MTEARTNHLTFQLYLQPSRFRLPLGTAFALIPVGYLLFLLLAVILVWLIARPFIPLISSAIKHVREMKP